MNTTTDLTVSNVADCAYAAGLAPSTLLERLLSTLENDLRANA